MNRKIAAACGSFLFAGIVARALPQDGPPLPKPQKEHEWLRQLVGEWDAEGEACMEPGKPPIQIKGTESSRMIGGFWAVFEHRGDFMGSPFTGIMTLGYDPERKKYVGTWIDSMGSYLWRYEGTLDASGRILTLDSEGPCHETPGKLAKYRESIEIKDKDRKHFVSKIERNGQWVTGMTMTSRRRK